METLKQFLEIADKAVVKTFTKLGEMPPVYHVIDGEDRAAVFSPPSRDKDESLMITRAALALMEAKRVLFITEAWTASEDQGSSAVQEFAARNSLEHWAGRKEMIVYAAEDAEEGSLFAVREIIREESQPPRLGPLVVQSKGGTYEGRMIGLLPTKGRRH